MNGKSTSVEYHKHQPKEVTHPNRDYTINLHSYTHTLYIYVCIVHMHVRMYVCTHVCMHVCTHVRMYVCTHVRMQVCTHVRRYVCTHVCMYVGMYARMHNSCDLLCISQGTYAHKPLSIYIVMFCSLLINYVYILMEYHN